MFGFGKPKKEPKDERGKDEGGTHADVASGEKAPGQVRAATAEAAKDAGAGGEAAIPRERAAAEAAPDLATRSPTAKEPIAARWKRWRWPVLAIALLFAVFFGMSYSNSQKFYLVVQGKHVLIKEGAFFPVGKVDYLPKNRSLGEVYAPIFSPSERVKLHDAQFRSIDELNARLFDLLFELADADIADEDNRDFARAREYIARAGKVPGVPTRKKDRLPGLRGDIAYREGQVVLRSVEEQMKLAEKWFTEAKATGTSRFHDVDARLRDVRRRLAGLNTTTKPQREQLEPAPAPAPAPTPTPPPAPAPGGRHQAPSPAPVPRPQ